MPMNTGYGCHGGTPRACGASLSTRCHRNAVPCYDDSLHWPWAGKTLNWCRIGRGNAVLPACIRHGRQIQIDRRSMLSHAITGHCLQSRGTACDHSIVIRHCMRSLNSYTTLRAITQQLYDTACDHSIVIRHCMRSLSTTSDYTEVYAVVRHCMQSHGTVCNHQYYMRSTSTTCNQSELHAITRHCMRSPSTTWDHSVLHAITRQVMRLSYGTTRDAIIIYLKQ